MNRQPKYGKEVIGQSLLMRFEVENEKHAWFKGRVKEMELQDDGEIKHRVMFQDRDYSWHDLKTMEDNQEMQWVRKVNADHMVDAIGRRVLMQFPIQNKKTAWFEGKICSIGIQARKKDACKYRIVFDPEEEECWYDLKEYARSGKLQFLGNRTQLGTSFIQNAGNSIAIKEESDSVISANDIAIKEDSNSSDDDSKRAATSTAIKDESIAVNSSKRAHNGRSSQQTNSRKKKRVKEDEDWTDGMEKWLRQTRKNSEKAEIANVMKLVRLLASGAGIRCESWDSNRFAFIGTKVDMSSPLSHFVEQAKAFSEEFGFDKASSLIGPLELILSFKKYILNSDRL